MNLQKLNIVLSEVVEDAIYGNGKDHGGSHLERRVKSTLLVFSVNEK